MIKDHNNIEEVLAMIMKDDKLRKRHPVPDDFNYLIARKLFMNPEVVEVTKEEITLGQVK